MRKTVAISNKESNKESTKKTIAAAMDELLWDEDDVAVRKWVEENWCADHLPATPPVMKKTFHEQCAGLPDVEEVVRHIMRSEPQPQDRSHPRIARWILAFVRSIHEEAAHGNNGGTQGNTGVVTLRLNEDYFVGQPAADETMKHLQKCLPAVYVDANAIANRAKQCRPFLHFVEALRLGKLSDVPGEVSAGQVLRYLAEEAERIYEEDKHKRIAAVTMLRYAFFTVIKFLRPSTDPKKGGAMFTLSCADSLDGYSKKVTVHMLATLFHENRAIFNALLAEGSKGDNGLDLGRHDYKLEEPRSNTLFFMISHVGHVDVGIAILKAAMLADAVNREPIVAIRVKDALDRLAGHTPGSGNKNAMKRRLARSILKASVAKRPKKPLATSVAKKQLASSVRRAKALQGAFAETLKRAVETVSKELAYTCYFQPLLFAWLPKMPDSWSELVAKFGTDDMDAIVTTIAHIAIGKTAVACGFATNTLHVRNVRNLLESCDIVPFHEHICHACKTLHRAVWAMHKAKSQERCEARSEARPEARPERP